VRAPVPNINKILIVDPDPNSVLQLAKPFRQHGWEMTVASDAVQAQSIVRKDKPNAVVLSSHLPGGALLMLKRIRASVHTVHLPVIVVAKSDGAQRAEFISAGANEFIAKSHDTAILCAALKKHLDSETAEAMVPLQAPASVIASPDRLAALEDSEILDSSPDPFLDRITQIAVKLFDVPVALLSIVDKDRQFFKSQAGLPEPWRSLRQTPLTHSICQWVVAGEEELTVEDTSEYPALEENRAIRDLGVVSYAGVPVFSVKGQVLGSFCVIDSKTRTWMPWELAHLRNLARISEAAILLESKNSASQRSRFQAMSNIIVNAAQILRREQTLSENPAYIALLEIIEQQAQKVADLLSEKLEEKNSPSALAHHA
jgi:CheY-like chemotaxis protein